MKRAGPLIRDQLKLIWFGSVVESWIMPGFASGHGWQQLFLTVGRKSLDKYVVLAAECFIGITEHILKQLKLSMYNHVTKQGKEGTVNSMLTNQFQKFSTTLATTAPTVRILMSRVIMHNIEICWGCATYYIFLVQVWVIAMLQMGLAGDVVVFAIEVMKNHRYMKNGFKLLKTPPAAKDEKLELHVIIFTPLRRIGLLC